MTDLLALAARVEAASGPDPILDADIMNAVVIGLWNHARPFTASLDTVVTLIPDGHKWSVFGGGYASVESWDGTEGDEECGFDHIHAATPALALLAASLRALAGAGA